jgi:hypothetical protein
MFCLPAVLAICMLAGAALAQQAQPADPPGARSTTAAIEAGIAWLLRHQEESGGWSASQFQRHDPKGDLCTGTGKPDQDLHVTAWATFALLSQGNTEREGKKEPVQKAIAWLQSQQQQDGFMGSSEASNAVEAHALACLAIARSKSRSGQPQSTATHARLAALRLPDGTWPARVGAKQGDPMATYWASQASFIASLASTDGSRFDLEPTLTAMAEGRLASPSPPSVEALLRWIAQHEPARDARLAEAMSVLGKQPPLWRDGADSVRMDFLDWHLGTHATFQDDAVAWGKWHAALLAALVAHQRTDGAHAGSWDPVDARGPQGGRVYATAVNVLSLAVGQQFERVVEDRRAGEKK